MILIDIPTIIAGLGKYNPNTMNEFRIKMQILLGLPALNIFTCKSLINLLIDYKHALNMRLFEIMLKAMYSRNIDDAWKFIEKNNIPSKDVIDTLNKILQTMIEKQ